MQTLQRVLRFLDRQSLWSALLLRVAVGATFTAHGAGKVFGSSILAFTPPVPLGGVLGPLVPIIEFFGGIFLILGLGTRVWALL
ncbi:MAG: DoxX family protein, partial [Planctomycetes bacterium]|nr:DoxX family protein [Planctomycetota bacterium]